MYICVLGPLQGADQLWLVGGSKTFSEQSRKAERGSIRGIGWYNGVAECIFYNLKCYKKRAISSPLIILKQKNQFSAAFLLLLGVKL